MAFKKTDYDFINLAVSIKGQADRLGIEHDGVPHEGVVASIAQRAVDAEARIAELEAELEVAMRPHSECERSGAEAGKRTVDLEGDLARAEARIAELEQSLRIETLAREVNGTLLHEYERRFAEAAKLHYRDTPSIGGDWCPEDHHKWPCPTAVSLELNEGEHDVS